MPVKTFEAGQYERSIVIEFESTDAAIHAYQHPNVSSLLLDAPGPRGVYPRVARKPVLGVGYPGFAGFAGFSKAGAPGNQRLK
jgi:hypothetical protein